MQISKLSSGICALAVCAVATVSAADNAAQAAARAALAQKLFESSAPPSSATNGVAVPKAAAVKPAATPVTPAMPVSPANSQTPSSDNAAQAAARAALAQRLFQVNAPQPATNRMAPAMVPVAIKPPVAVKSEPMNKVVAPAPVSAKVEQPVAPTTPKPAPAATVSYPGKDLGMPPIAPPPSPISPEKQAKLDELLAKYKADQISPDEYQRQRAAILAAP